MLKATVNVVRNQAGDILLLQRTGDHPKSPNQWCFPGGKVDWYNKEVKVKLSHDSDAVIKKTVTVEETYEEAAIRECLEETGIQLTTLLDVGEWLSDKDYVVKVFHSTTDQAVTREFPNREHVGFMWVNEENIPEEVGPMTLEQLTSEFQLNTLQ